MKRNITASLTLALTAVLILTGSTEAGGVWHAPFDTAGSGPAPVDSPLSLDDVLALVASENPGLRSLSLLRQAAGGKLIQAGLWSNPELDIELEEAGWDAPGFKESEFSVSLSQEFEFFGQRSARENAARAGIDAITLETRLSAFDLYLETKQRFYALGHAQRRLELSQASVELATEIVENVSFRSDRGAALQSELLLAQLEEQRELLALDQAGQDVDAIRATLVALWAGSISDEVAVSTVDPDLSRLRDKLALLTTQADSTRSVLQLQIESKVLRAERDVAIAEARPTVTLSGGFKRLEANKSKSFLLGVSLPIPFLNRNQGTRESIDAHLRSIEYQIDQEEHEARANMRFLTIRLNQLIDRHATLDSVLLPTAQRAYSTLKSIYEAGRLPYTQLLEAERALNEFGSESNDLLLEIHEQIMAIESITGVAVRTDKE